MRPGLTACGKSLASAVLTIGLLVVLSTTGPITAETPPPASLKPHEELPGYFDLDGLSLFSKDELEVHISVKGPLLRLVAGATSDDEPELAEMLSRLRGVEVRVYSTNERLRTNVRKTLDSLANTLGKEGWQPAITVRVDRNHGYAFLRYDTNGPQPIPVGLAAMYLTDDNQAVFVNIVGELDTATIGRLAQRFDLDLLAVEEPVEGSAEDP